MLKILTMYKKLFLLLSLMAITMCGCSTNDEPITPEVSLPELTDQGYLPEVVSDAGAVVSVTFDINTDWYIYSNDGIDVVSSSGGKGKKYSKYSNSTKFRHRIQSWIRVRYLFFKQ